MMLYEDYEYVDLNDNEDDQNDDDKSDLITGMIEAAGYKVREVDKGLGVVASARCH